VNICRFLLDAASSDCVVLKEASRTFEGIGFCPGMDVLLTEKLISL